MTLDGVIQNEENDGDGFNYGGWYFPYASAATGAVLKERLGEQVDLLLGRKTFDIWEPYWPAHSDAWPNVMTATKYVASNTRDSSDWEKTVFLSGDLAEKVRELKATTDQISMCSEVRICFRRFLKSSCGSAGVDDNPDHAWARQTAFSRRHSSRCLQSHREFDRTERRLYRNLRTRRRC